MKRTHAVRMLMGLLCAGITVVVVSGKLAGGEPEPKRSVGAKVKLPSPVYDSSTSVEQALLRRRSVREYKDEPIGIVEVSQLLWAAQGITEPARGFRTAPSAGALYPLEVYVVVGNVKELEPGVYRYQPHQHELERVRKGDVRAELSTAVLKQGSVLRAAIIVVFCAVYERTTTKFGDAGIRYVHMEVGHAAQNLYLQAVSLKLGAGIVGEFPDEEVKKALNAQEDEQPLYIMPVGVR